MNPDQEEPISGASRGRPMKAGFLPKLRTLTSYSRITSIRSTGKNGWLQGRTSFLTTPRNLIQL